MLNSVTLVLLGVCHKPFLSTARKKVKKRWDFLGRILQRNKNGMRHLGNAREVQAGSRTWDAVLSASLTHLLRLEDIILCFQVPKCQHWSQMATATYLTHRTEQPRAVSGTCCTIGHSTSLAVRNEQKVTMETGYGAEVGKWLNVLSDSEYPKRSTTCLETRSHYSDEFPSLSSKKTDQLSKERTQIPWSLCKTHMYFHIHLSW